MSQASNVLLTKSRAMFGKRLTAQNISDLLGCQTVTEVAVYLKNNTHYAYALRNIDESNVHRGQLEAALDELIAERNEAMKLAEKYRDMLQAHGIVLESELLPWEEDA